MKNTSDSHGTPPGDGSYRPLTRRRRMLILLLAISTAITVVLMLLYPPGGVKRHKPPALEPSRCAQGQSGDCVGGATAVIVAPAASAASAR